MKQALLIMTAAVLFACNNSDKKEGGPDTTAQAQAQDARQNALTDTANYTEIQWLDSTLQDLGKVEDGQVVDISWKFRNTGSKPLVVAKVEPGCGCTVAEKPEQPVAPGGEGIIRARFDSKGQSMGTHMKGVTAMVNTKQQNYYLQFKVNVIKN